MGIEITIETNASLRSGVALASKYSSDGIVNLMFGKGTLTMLGYTNTTFCICKEYIDCNTIYSLRIQSGALQSILGCPQVRFSIETKAVLISGLDKSGNLVRRARIKYNTDGNINYVAESYQDIIGRLRSGYSCKSLESMKRFDKISRINDKAERGVVISNNQFYTGGNGFKYYSTTEMKFNCFILGDDLKKLIDFVGGDECILYQQDGLVVAKNKNECYFGVRVSDPLEDAVSVRAITKMAPVCSFMAPIAELKSSLRPLRTTSKVSDGKIIFYPQRNIVSVVMPDVAFELAIGFTDFSGEVIGDITLNYKLFNRLLQTIDVSARTTISVYPNFISMLSTDESLLLISRE